MEKQDKLGPTNQRDAQKSGMILASLQIEPEKSFPRKHSHQFWNFGWINADIAGDAGRPTGSPLCEPHIQQICETFY